MIVLDTHIWVWWVHDAPELPPTYRAEVERHEPDGLGVSAISCWEVAKLVELGRLTLPLPVEVWLSRALAEPGIRLLPLTPQIAVESTRLAPPFHRDPLVLSAWVVAFTHVLRDSHVKPLHRTCYTLRI